MEFEPVLYQSTQYNYVILHTMQIVCVQVEYVFVSVLGGATL